MLREAIRRLTANYTQEEYNDYLYNDGHSYLYCDGLKTWIDMDMNMNEWYYAKKLHYTSFRQIAEDLAQVADDTGYEYSYLADRFMEQLHDGNSAEESMEHVAGVSYEFDW